MADCRSPPLPERPAVPLVPPQPHQGGGTMSIKLGGSTHRPLKGKKVRTVASAFADSDSSDEDTETKIAAARNRRASGQQEARQHDEQDERAKRLKTWSEQSNSSPHPAHLTPTGLPTPPPPPHSHTHTVYNAGATPPVPLGLPPKTMQKTATVPPPLPPAPTATTTGSQVSKAPNQAFAAALARARAQAATLSAARMTTTAPPPPPPPTLPYGAPYTVPQVVQPSYPHGIVAPTEISTHDIEKKLNPKIKHGYDSDEDIDGGTWEHKRRKREMEKTAEAAAKATRLAKGRHHLGDFIPPDELERFLEYADAITTGRDIDMSDYKKYKLTQENLGYQMLQKAGWNKDKGLGISEQGITAPVNKGDVSEENRGLGQEKSAVVKKDDDIYAQYRKRMQLGYKNRPNPLNNPRRPYSGY